MLKTYIIQFLLGATLIFHYPIIVHFIAALNEWVSKVEKAGPTRNISTMATTMISIKEAALHSSLFVFITGTTILFACNNLNFSYFLTLAGAIITYITMVKVLDLNAAGMWTRRSR